MVYKIKYYAYLLKNINIGFFTFRIKVGSGAGSGSVFFLIWAGFGSKGKEIRILIPMILHNRHFFSQTRLLENSSCVLWYTKSITQVRLFTYLHYSIMFTLFTFFVQVTFEMLSGIVRNPILAMLRVVGKYW